VFDSASRSSTPRETWRGLAEESAASLPARTLESWKTCSSGRPAAAASRIAFSPSRRKWVRSSIERPTSRLSGLDGDSITATDRHAITGEDEVPSGPALPGRRRFRIRSRLPALRPLDLPRDDRLGLPRGLGSRGGGVPRLAGPRSGDPRARPDVARVRGRGGGRLGGGGGTGQGSLPAHTLPPQHSGSYV